MSLYARYDHQIIGLLVKTYMAESRSLGFPSCPSGPSKTRQRERREERKRLSQKLDGRKCHELQQRASSCSYGRPSSGRLRDAANCTTRSCLLLILSESGLHGLGGRRPQSCDQRGRPVESRQCGREGTLPPPSDVLQLALKFFLSVPPLVQHVRSGQRLLHAFPNKSRSRHPWQGWFEFLLVLPTR